MVDVGNTAAARFVDEIASCSEQLTGVQRGIEVLSKLKDSGQHYDEARLARLREQETSLNRKLDALTARA